MKEEIIECVVCKGDLCYKTEITKDVTNYSCLGCGFISSNLMKEGQDFWDEQVEIMPELHKDLIFKDNTGQFWMPTTVNIEEVGMIFANGSSKNNWNWAAVKAVEIPEEDRKRFPIPNKKGQFYKKRMDMKTLMEFPSDKGFMDGMDYLGLFNI